MRKTILLMFALFSGVSIMAQDNTTYKVIRVQGQIMNKDDNNYLNTGDIFDTGDELDFVSATSKAAVINPEKGRKIITASNYASLSGSRSSYLPPMSNLRGKPSREAHAPAPVPEIQRQAFIGSSFYLVYADDYTFGQGQHFVMEYRDGDQLARQKLERNGDTLWLDKTRLLSVAGDTLMPGNEKMVTIYYQENDTLDEMVDSFVAVFPNEEQLQEEIEIILAVGDIHTMKDLYQEALGYVDDFYGFTNKEAFKSWLNARYDLPGAE